MRQMFRKVTERIAPVGVLALLLIAACEGPVGPKGDPGESGPPGPSADTGTPMDAAPDGDAAPPAEIPLEPEGLVGRVTNPADHSVRGGRVVLIIAEDVAALAATEIDPLLPNAEAAASTIDEPIEDLTDDASRGYMEAITDSNGVYRFTSLPDEPVFVVYVPAATDTAHFPGGTFSRAAQAPASLLGSRLDIRVSARQSPDARYVGSSPCLSCHGRHTAFGTAHFVGLTVPRARGPRQDVSNWSEFDAIFDRFGGTTLNFYDCDGAAPGPGRCKVSETAPGAPAVVSFEAELLENASVPVGETGRYQVTLRNRRGGGAATYDVELAYGGALWRSQLLVNIPGTDGRPVRYALPFQYQHQGDDTRADSDDWVWRDVGSSDWYDHGAGSLQSPAVDTSFDAACAGCHFTGYSVEGDSATGLHASAIPVAEGEYDYDGDGRLEQINLGCETCHGPGSEHIEAHSRGEAIVSPKLLTPGRELAICGACHSRPANTTLPLDADGRMPRPGIRRSELIANHWGGSEVLASDLHPSGDARAHRLQYTDLIRSHMYRNDDELVTCIDCHDPHGTEEPHDLLFGIRDNSGCTECHNDPDFINLNDHALAQTGNDHSGAGAGLACTLCHMPRTASGGSMVESLFDDNPSTAPPVQYFEGDLASHRYHPSGFAVASEQPASVTQTCAVCHKSILPNPP